MVNVIRGIFDSRKAPSVGLVLGAGGVVGQAYQAGVLAALQREAGWDPRGASIIVGTSAGLGTGGALRGRGARRGAAGRRPRPRPGGIALRRVHLASWRRHSAPHPSRRRRAAASTLVPIA